MKTVLPLRKRPVSIEGLFLARRDTKCKTVHLGLNELADLLPLNSKQDIGWTELVVLNRPSIWKLGLSDTYSATANL